MKKAFNIIVFFEIPLTTVMIKQNGCAHLKFFKTLFLYIPSFQKDNKGAITKRSIIYL